MSAQESGVYRFAGCELDPRERRLLVRGQAVALTPKVFDTLVLLAGRAGQVVSKEELIATLWPRGFVHESNLTKHIWLIRRALGDGEDGGCIETVPKLGYRFVVPVQQVPREALGARAPVAPTDAEPESEPAPPASSVDESGEFSPPDTEPAQASDRVEGRDNDDPAASEVAVQQPRRIATRFPLRITLIVTMTLIVSISVLIVWQHRSVVQSKTTPVAIAASADPASLTIVDFNNLSGQSRDAWLGPALEQMLATEIASDGSMHAVSEELVRPARLGLPPPEAGGYAAASLATLRQRLGARYILSGSYLVTGPADALQLRVDLIVQDTRTGKPAAVISRTAPIDGLPQLLAQLGADLRGKLGLHAADASQLQSTANAQPPSAEVARHVSIALDALGRSDPAQARDELLLAIAQAPGYAPAYIDLARAWSALGYRAKAVAAAQQALANADGLSNEDRLQMQALQYGLQGDSGKAADTYGQLLRLRPGNPVYRLQAIAALTDAGRFDAADAALAQATAMPALAGDPRLELAALAIAQARGNGTLALAHAKVALQRARARGEPGLIAQAELQLGIALDQDAQAEPMLRAAIADFQKIGNPYREAQAWQNLGNLQFARNQIAQARDTYQHAMAMYQQLGSLGGEAAVYDDLSRMLWAAGDRDGTEVALQQALAIARKTDDKEREAWSLTGLATVVSDAAASDDAVSMYQQAIALDRETHNVPHLLFALSTYADLLRMRGQLDEARATCTQALAIARGLPDATLARGSQFECAQVALDRGDIDAAQAMFAQIEHAADADHDVFSAANAQLELGQIAMGRQQWNVARDWLRKSLAGWTAQQETAGIANTSALLALCAVELGDKAGRDQMYAHGMDLRAKVTMQQEVFVMDMALAELRADMGKFDQALPALRQLADDATKRRWVGFAFEARLAMQRVLDRGPDRAVANTARTALAADARKAGFGWVGQRLALAAPKTDHPVTP
ncbi:MAG: tetratricopeptide repeat protein [Proteobacteria bacterium]|nr:tetratricopeptide repeat protein [Pseudomonadota bacterium]